ncbi:bifunctional DNA-formamidopyrimidine glycosylase/DNA-(apurinic or apyrimidinic site) lyase [Pirellula sp. SH-Sr6A]|uniref:bifunctional DNA-formamidopyrimidine glycosylase/DNA-(apurinic or apyrimidinic site) lyase n=1 Tax=Pirellula sp. SH-Sr6A TaxID=1632865 RepID=UPI000B1E9D81|nr:bifunctional DNA-formamidopyrimidine glycosylase/DNA-(apurinic or apyrimidinic site) lyase [Pirellula sp. SH-Sr6A]
MPELPEVETMRRGLLPIVGSRITEVEFPEIPYRPIVVLPDREAFARGCLGKQIRDVRRIAKRVLVDLDNGLSIVMQPKMAGIAMLRDAPSPQHIRVLFHLDRPAPHDQFLYWDRRGLGNVCLWSQAEIDAVLGPNRLGPDASIVDADLFVSRFRECNREVKVAMLDQSLVAGIGNLYAAEILFAAKIHPQQRCTDLSTRQWKRIHEETIRILQQAIENEGSTLKDGTYRNAINGEGGYQSMHRVYDREGLPCTRCSKGTVQRIVQGQRSTFFCPRCQKIQ